MKHAFSALQYMCHTIRHSGLKGCALLIGVLMCCDSKEQERTERRPDLECVGLSSDTGPSCISLPQQTVPSGRAVQKTHTCTMLPAAGRAHSAPRMPRGATRTLERAV